MEVSPGWRPSFSYIVHPDIASLASRPPLGISGAPLKARSRDLKAGEGARGRSLVSTRVDLPPGGRRD